MLSRQESGLHAAHVNIELNKNRVVWSYYGTRFKPIGFDEIINGQFSFPPEFAAGLHVSPDELNARIRRIIKDKHIETVAIKIFDFLVFFNLFFD